MNFYVFGSEPALPSLRTALQKLEVGLRSSGYNVGRFQMVDEENGIGVFFEFYCPCGRTIREGFVASLESFTIGLPFLVERVSNELERHLSGEADA